MSRITYILIFLLSLCSHGWAKEGRYATNSRLSEGKWVKIRVDKTGIYKISYAELNNMGFSNPANVSIHGYGGWPLEENFESPYIDDLPAVSVWRGNDYLLFYGRGPVKWKYDGAAFVHTNNPYSTYGYYFVTDSGEPKEAQQVAPVDGAATRITTFDDYMLHEQDLVSVNQSGRELFGESFVLAQPRTISTFSSIPGITNADGLVTMRFISRLTSGMGVASLSINNSHILDVNLSRSTSTYTKAVAGTRAVTWMGEKSEKPSVVVSYNSAGHKNVHLDYIRLQFERTLRPYGAFTLFRSLRSVGNASRFVIQGAGANMQVFDVTDPLDMKVMQTEQKEDELSFTIPKGESLREFALVQTGQAIQSPAVVGEVAPQDLHALPQQDMIIIAPPGLTIEANRLAEEHRVRSGLKVEVVLPETIYNEFSSGTPDATAYRRFLKMFYDRAATEGNPPKYLLLFGDGLYDNRGLCPDVSSLSKENMLLTYQSEESLNIDSYVTDDYFGFLEDKSGTYLPSDKLCIGIGRFPARTATEAAQMVDKVILYMNNLQRGSWKNHLSFVADDGSNLDTFTVVHMQQADQLAEYIESDHPEFITNKVLFDAFKRDNTGTYPDVRKKISKLLKEGQLLINYVGHGNTVAWSDEYVWTQSDIQQSTYTRLPVWVTATCDFTRFDDPKTSAGESVFLNPVSGGIGLFTTTRVVYSQDNFMLNKALMRNLFSKENGRRRTLGEAMKDTKNDLFSNSNKLNFILIGDPAMHLAYPDHKARVTAVNGVPVSDQPYAFEALAKVTVEGEILNEDGSVANGFTGLLSPTVFDSRANIKTLGNNTVKKYDKEGNLVDSVLTITYADYPNMLYIGRDSVRDGKFNFTFMVPKDISYSKKKGKLNLYASDNINGDEAQGSFFNFEVGGTSQTAETDTIGPEIRALYLNDSSFVSGDQVNSTPYFVVRLWDKSGVNITGSSVGHDIVLVIDNEPSRTYTLNDYYAMQPGKEGEGIAQFSLPELEPGIHTAEFKVWDILNNSTTYTFTFEVVEGLKPNLIEVLATPNPAKGQVQFYLYHNRPETNVKVTIMVYDMSGKFLWSTERSGSSELFKASVVTWDLRDNGGRRLRPGIYLYRAAISTNNSKEATKANKLIILAQ